MATIINTALSSRVLCVDTRPQPASGDYKAKREYEKDHPQLLKLELAPGPNKVDDALWLQFCESPFVAQLVERGTLVERDDLSSQEFAAEKRHADERREAEVKRRDEAMKCQPVESSKAGAL